MTDSRTAHDQALSAHRALPLLVLLCLALYLPGIQWGLPGVVSWSQDTIAGVRTLGAVRTWPQEWSGRYPPLQYFLNRAAYEPLLSYWRSRGEVRIGPEGAYVFEMPQAPKIGALVLTSRFISAVMGAGAVVLLWFAARRFTDDVEAAAIAALSFGGGAAFVYFAHLGNVDVPSLYWLAASLLFYAKALKSRRLLDAALLGLAGGLCVSTKDNWAGLYPGMAVVLLVVEWGRLRAGAVRQENGEYRIANCDLRGARRTGRRDLAFLQALLQWRWLIGALAFVIPYTVLNGIPWNAQGWMSRLQSLADAIEGGEYRHANVFALAVASVRQAAGAVGWPMLAGMIIACGFGLWRRPGLALTLLVPCATYYGIVIARIGFVYERFLLGPMMLVSILLGAMFADFMRLPTGGRWARVSSKLGRATLLAILIPTFAYATAVDLEMINDSRYVTEQWFGAHVPRSASVGALTGDLEHFAPQYLPRIHEMGYATYPVLAVGESFAHPQPEYLLLSEYDYQDFSQRQRECVDDLIMGKLGYAPVAEFRGQFLGAAHSWLSLAGWGAPPPGKISPTITVLRRAMSNVD